MEVSTPEPRRSRLGSLPGIEVVATGSYVPERVVRNEDLTSIAGFDPEWIVQRTGICERRHAPPEQATSDLAYEAARRCIDRSGVRAGDIDLLIVATFTPDMSLPSTACIVQDRLGITAPSFDLQAACAGFMYALVTAGQFLATGANRLALVVGADCNTRLLNPQDRGTYPLFGDGAGAALLRAGDPRQGILSYALGADGAGGPLLCRPMGGSRLPWDANRLDEGLHFVRMDGRAVFKWAVRVMKESILEVLSAAGMTVDQLDLVVFHQANLRIIEAAADALGIEGSKLMINLDRYGNTSAGSIPLALDEACQQGRVRRGNNILLSGFGAGLAWGTALLRW